MKESAEPGRSYYSLCANIISRIDDSDIRPEAPLTSVENYAVMMADTLRKMMTEAVTEMFYQPAQDYLAELWDDKRKMLVDRHLVGKDVTPEEYIEQVMTGINTIKQHIDEGRSRGLTDEQIFLHDEIYGMLMDRFDDDIITFATELSTHGDQLRRKQKDEADFVAAYMERFNEIRQRLVDAGTISESWLTTDGLAAGYVYEHARKKFNGRFN